MKKPKTHPIVERGRGHAALIAEVMQAVENGYSVEHQDQLALVAEIRDLRARLNAPVLHSSNAGVRG